MAFTSADLASVDAAIIALATKEAASVTSNGQTVVYKRDDIPALLQLRSAIQQSIDASSSNGGMFLIKPMGRT